MSDRLWMIATVVPLALSVWIVSAWLGFMPGQTPPVRLVFLIVGLSGFAAAITLHRAAPRASRTCFVAAVAMLLPAGIRVLGDLTMTIPPIIGIAIAVWFGRTAGRLGHGFGRAVLWSVIGLSLFLAPLLLMPILGLPWIDEFRPLGSASEADVAWSLWASRALAIVSLVLPALVGNEILLKTKVPKLSVLREETNR